MPYISRARADAILAGSEPEDAGELTYEITTSALRFWRRGPKRFLTLCIIVGVFMCALLEFYRRVVAPYEDRKREENGDVYD